MVDSGGFPTLNITGKNRGPKAMFRKSASLLIAVIAVAALPSTASAFCESCYMPPPQPCTTCYQMQTVAPQYRTVQETVPVTKEVTVNVTNLVPVQKQGTRTVYTTVPVTREVEVPVTTFQTEQRTGTRTNWVPQPITTTVYAASSGSR